MPIGANAAEVGTDLELNSPRNGARGALARIAVGLFKGYDIVGVASVTDADHRRTYGTR
jgi:hypothetical protein